MRNTRCSLKRRVSAAKLCYENCSHAKVKRPLLRNVPDMIIYFNFVRQPSGHTFSITTSAAEDSKSYRSELASAIIFFYGIWSSVVGTKAVKKSWSTLFFTALHQSSSCEYLHTSLRKNVDNMIMQYVLFLRFFSEPFWSNGNCSHCLEALMLRE